MKKHGVIVVASLLAGNVFSQNYYPTTGNVGLGTPTSASNFNLQINGSSDYSVTYPSQPAMYDIFGNLISPAQAGYTTNFGKTARLGLTNTLTGTTSADGLLIRMSENNATIENLEKQNIVLSSATALLTVSGAYGRVNVGPGTFAGPDPATFNVYAAADNGINIENNKPGTFGLKVKTKQDADFATKIYGSAAGTLNFATLGSGKTTIYNGVVGLSGTALSVNSGTVENFAVKGNGEVRFTTTNMAGATALSLNNGTASFYKLNADGSLYFNTPSPNNNFKLFSYTNANGGLLQLTNDGVLRARSIRVDANVWSDYVFEKNYRLRSLEEVDAYIRANGHLPEVPSAAEVAKNGIDLLETNALLLKKVEELTLYLINQNDRLAEQKCVIDRLSRELKALNEK